MNGLNSPIKSPTHRLQTQNPATYYLRKINLKQNDE